MSFDSETTSRTGSRGVDHRFPPPQPVNRSPGAQHPFYFLSQSNAEAGTREHGMSSSGAEDDDSGEFTNEDEFNSSLTTVSAGSFDAIPSRPVFVSGSY
jgi:hypothetical protein